MPLPPVTSTRAVFSMSIRGFSNGDHGGQRHPSGRPRLTPVGAPAIAALLFRPRHVVRTSRPRVVVGGVVAPYRRPLRPVLVPGPRLEIAELLVMHLVEIGEELDRDAVGILVIDRDVVPDQVADRPPEQLDVLAGEEVAGAGDRGCNAGRRRSRCASPTP